MVIKMQRSYMGNATGAEENKTGSHRATKVKLSQHLATYFSFIARVWRDLCFEVSKMWIFET